MKMSEKTRILYMGTPLLSATILEGLISKGFNIIGLICQVDKPVGRKAIIEPVPTKKVALKNNIPVYQPHRIRLDYAFVKDLKPDLILTCAYGQILPQELLDIPPLGSINVHGSLLPKYRGASPIQQALINGDKETGVTIMEMVNKMDAGAMIKKVSFPLLEEDNYTSTCVKMATAGLEGLLEVLPLIEQKKETREEQDENQVSFCKKITKEEEHLNLNLTNVEVNNWIRALSDTPGGYLLLDNQVFKIYKAELTEGNGKIGEVIKADKNGLVIMTRHGALKLLEVQKQGKKRMDYKSFLNGEKNLLGKILL